MNRGRALQRVLPQTREKHPMGNWKRLLRRALACAACALGNTLHPVQAAQEHHHHHAESAPGYARQSAIYRMPQTTLLRSDGAKASFPDEIDDGRPVVLNFIFTTC